MRYINSLSLLFIIILDTVKQDGGPSLMVMRNVSNKLSLDISISAITGSTKTIFLLVLALLRLVLLCLCLTVVKTSENWR